MISKNTYENSAANTEFTKKRQRRLRKNPAAMQWLDDVGLNSATINLYKLGLAENYLDKENRQRANALLAPVLNADGIFTSRAVYRNVPGVTVNPLSENRWLHGAPATYHSEKFIGQTSLLVLDDLLDLWLTQQLLGEWREKMNLLLICSTHTTDFPSEWEGSQFWSRFERVFLGYENNAAGDEKTARLLEKAGWEMRRLRLPLEAGADWSDFWRRGGSVEEFYRYLSESAVIGAPVSFAIPKPDLLGRFSYRPVDVMHAFHRGHLYYPVKTLVSSLETVGASETKNRTRQVSRTETVVVRSDGTLHTIVVEPCPRGTAPQERVRRLTDGTLIDSSLAPPFNPTWSWNFIEHYLKKRHAARPLKDILRDVNNHLRISVRLSFDYDYDVAALMIAASYVQAIFDVVPVAFIDGDEPEQAKRLGKTMSALGANAVSFPLLPARQLCGLLDRTNGFVHLNYRNFQEKAATANAADKENDSAEMLELLGNTGIKALSSDYRMIDERSGQVAVFNLFGVKLIDCSGSAGRSALTHNIEFKIYASDDEFPSKSAIEIVETEKVAVVLRNELHRWAFDSVSSLADLYRNSFPLLSESRRDCGAALKVLAELAGDENIEQNLETALRIRDEGVLESSDPVETMIQAVKNLVRQGYMSPPAFHIILEMKRLSGSRFKRSAKTELCWEDPSWVGRKLRIYDLVDAGAPARRVALNGQMIRYHPLKESFIDLIRAENNSPVKYLEKSPVDFCRSCADCVYRMLDCPMMSFKSKPDLSSHSLLGPRPATIVAPRQH